MTFETEMKLFFARNCYTQKQVLAIKSFAAYRLAAERGDVVQAQEIATRILEDKMRNYVE